MSAAESEEVGTLESRLDEAIKQVSIVEEEMDDDIGLDRRRLRNARELIARTKMVLEGDDGDE